MALHQLIICHKIPDWVPLAQEDPGQSSDVEISILTTSSQN